MEKKRDSKGRWKKGYSGNGKQVKPESKCLRSALKDEVIRVAHSLTLSIDSINFEMNNGAISRLQYLLNKKLREGDVSFVKDMLDRAIGRAQNAPAIDPGLEAQMVSEITDDSRISNMVIAARDEKISHEVKLKEANAN